jgi:hypothetical protein
LAVTPSITLPALAETVIQSARVTACHDAPPDAVTFTVKVAAADPVKSIVGKIDMGEGEICVTVTG